MKNLRKLRSHKAHTISMRWDANRRKQSSRYHTKEVVIPTLLLHITRLWSSSWNHICCLTSRFLEKHPSLLAQHLRAVFLLSSDVWSNISDGSRIIHTFIIQVWSGSTLSHEICQETDTSGWEKRHKVSYRLPVATLIIIHVPLLGFFGASHLFTVFIHHLMISLIIISQ